MKLVNIGCGSNYNVDWINLDLYKSKFVKKHNIKKPLPFNTETVNVIYHSHVLEHLSKKEADRFIAECFRVLKKGGIMRVVIPDLEQICREYLKNLEAGYSANDNSVISKYKWNKIEIFDQIIREKSGGEMIDFITDGNIDSEYVFTRNGDELKDLFNKAQKTKSPLKDILKLLLNKIRKSPQKSGESHKWMYDKLDLKLLLEKHDFSNFAIMKYNESNISDWGKYNLDKSKNGDYARKPDSLYAEVKK